MTPTSSYAEPAGTRPTLPPQIAQQRVIAVLRGLPPDRLPQIDAVTAPAFLAAGTVAVGTDGGLIRGGDPEVIGARARELVAAVATP